MEVKRRIIIMRKDGKPVDLFFQPVKAISHAARFYDVEDYHAFMKGYYGRKQDPTRFYPQEIEITYREVVEDDTN